MPAYFPFLLGSHIILAVSLVLPSILLPFTLRTRRATVESDNGVVRSLLWAQTHGTIAIEATIANARRNALVRRLRAREGSLPSGEAAFDVVLANLIAGLLVPLAAGLRDEVRPGGHLLASGIFIDREDDVRVAFEAAGLEVTGRTAEAIGWPWRPSCGAERPRPYNRRRCPSTSRSCSARTSSSR